jgi:hypothetical protein
MSGAAMQLARATNLPSFGNWVAVSSAPYTNGAFTLFIPVGASPSAFFRLQK